MSRQVERVIGMEKGFSNSFASNPSAKFGLSPNPGAFGTGNAGPGAASVGRKRSKPSMAGDIKRGTAMSGGSVQAGANAARRTSGKSHRDKVDRAGSKTVSRHAMDPELFSSEDDLLRGFIMSEVLGKPKCLRRGGGRL